MPVVLQDGWGGRRERSRRRDGLAVCRPLLDSGRVSDHGWLLMVTDSSAVAGVPWKVNSPALDGGGEARDEGIDSMVSHTRRRVAGMRVFAQSGGEEVGADDRKSGPRCQRRPRRTDQGSTARRTSDLSHGLGRWRRDRCGDADQDVGPASVAVQRAMPWGGRVGVIASGVGWR